MTPKKPLISLKMTI